jgi:hypothetical protein
MKRDPDLRAIKMPSAIVHRAKIQASIRGTSIQQLAVAAIEPVLQKMERESGMNRFAVLATEKSRAK